MPERIVIVRSPEDGDWYGLGLEATDTRRRTMLAWLFCDTVWDLFGRDVAKRLDERKPGESVQVDVEITFVE